MTTLDLEVTDIATGGDGIAHHDDGRIVFVAGAIPGDRVRAEVTKDLRRRLHARTVEVIESATGRIQPPCPHVARGCGGCGWQHIEPRSQIALKQRIAVESLRRLGGVDGDVSIGPALPSTGFRTTARCVVDDAGRPGFRAGRSHRPVPVDTCLVLHPGIAELLDARFVGIGEVTLRIGADGSRLAVVDAEPTSISGMPDDVVVVGPADDAPGPPNSYIERVASVTFQVSARSFFQSRTDGAAALVDAVRAAAGDAATGPGTMADLYGGVGLFAATVGAGLAGVLIESAPSSVADARVNLADTAFDIVGTTVEDWTPSLADLVVADPPRAGLGRHGVDATAATGAHRVVLVHCDAAAFGRDIGLFAAAGYHHRSTVLIDLFPHTPHLELVTRLDR